MEVDSPKMNAAIRMTRGKKEVIQDDLRLLNINKVTAHRVENVDEHAIGEA
ncbi:hypothetical protein D3C86_1962560 [compost metagenome]